MEKFNSTLCQMLSFYVSPRHDDWDQCVPFVSFAYHSSVQASTKESPFYLLYGRDARLPIDAAYQSYRRWSEIGVADYARSVALRLTEASDLARKYIGMAQERQKRNYDKRVKATEYSVGDKVYNYTPVWQAGECKKFVHTWRGPLTLRLIKYPNLCLFDEKAHHKPLSWAHVNRVKCAYGFESATEEPNPQIEIPTLEDHDVERAETAPVVTDQSHHYNLRPRVSTFTVGTVYVVSGDLRLGVIQGWAMVIPPKSNPPVLTAKISDVRKPLLGKPNKRIPKLPQKLSAALDNTRILDLGQIGMRSPLEPREGQCIRCTGFGHVYRVCPSLSDREKDLVRRGQGDAVGVALLQMYKTDPKAKRLLSIKQEISAGRPIADCTIVES
ncbi:MAG: hypothetical protein GY696_30940, partial [Gammaproteobacteria bacterium]|nr:hypothetical protein [Gammaproteobacteria bacterium]